ncbi:hypothetical protein SLEP1_g4876 [Rubroshorea leprosula]|uniref:Reverse transcriptase n=1 Tax=Rubroshorea leprosula TaxID=152421 RepID=A0AAV5HZW2_9ROSI|nr:hypothetical protein SLEP1_g4876 [Rubroshorea leprosula]
MMAEHRNPQPPTQPNATPIPIPLNTNIIQKPYPSGFKMPQFETYDGNKDPNDQLYALYSIMQTQNASDALMCKRFPSTLRGNAQTCLADFDGVVAPHNDPLVTSIIVNNCEVQHVFVDTGSAPSIMYYHCFESLGLDPTFLQKYDGPIYGFNNQPVLVEGVLKLNVAFSLIPPLHEILHPVGVATLKGNQEMARHCYMTLVKRPRKDKQLTLMPTQLEVSTTQQVMGVELLDNRLEDEAKPTRQKKWKSSKKAPIWGREVASNQGRGAEAFTGRVYKKSKLLRIDKLVKAASGNEWFSLLDAYSGYHQVHMAPEDGVKTSFNTGDEIYCYVMMPFGLKNAGAMYQKMVMIVFRTQIDSNLEVYVDDIMVKSLKAKDHLINLGETFDNLRKHNMKLNPVKCVFRVESAQKDKAGKPKKFEWTSECQTSFNELKAYLNSPPLLTKVKEGEILYLYLGIFDKTLRYFIAEKATLAVVTTTRKLRSYFQVHHIIILKNQPLRQILQKPECLGKLIKWAMELGEFQITFQQRSLIRAQALADFLVECTSNQGNTNFEVELWTLYVDGAFNSKELGVRAVLIGPENFRSQHALKFNFEATNNMAEYEALLLGLRLATELKSDLYRSGRPVYVEVINEPSIQTSKVMEVNINPETPSWTDPIRAYLRDGTVPNDKREEMKLQRKAS